MQATHLKRFYALQAWVESRLKQPIKQAIALPKNASFRRYYRLELSTPSPPMLAVDSPAHIENNADFIKLANTLSNLNVCVPRVIADDTEQGFLLVDDLGDQTLEKALNTEKATLLYEKALTTLVHLQSQADHATLKHLPIFSVETMQQQLANCQHWFLETFLALHIDNTTQQQLNTLFSDIASQLHTQPITLMHSDYQCRNIMWLNKQQIALLDFQDLCFGPASYDVASLLWDCYLDWPASIVKQWLWFYYEAACKKAIMPPVGIEIFTQHFYWAALQRHLKNTFIFARKYLRDNEPLYLRYLPRTLAYVNNALRSCLGDHPICHWFERVVTPAASKRLANRTGIK